MTLEQLIRECDITVEKAEYFLHFSNCPLLGADLNQSISARQCFLVINELLSYKGLAEFYAYEKFSLDIRDKSELYWNAYEAAEEEVVTKVEIEQMEKEKERKRRKEIADRAYRERINSILPYDISGDDSSLNSSFW